MRFFGLQRDPQAGNAENGGAEPECRAELAAVEVDALPGEQPGPEIPGEMDEDPQPDRQARRCDARPRPQVRAGQGRDLDDALGPDDDVGESEPVVGEGGEELTVELPGAGVTLPALARRDDLVDAVGGQGGDEPVDVAGVLGDRVALVEVADLRIELGRDFTPVELEDRVALVHALEHVVGQAERMRDGTRRITNVTEVIGTEGDVIITQDLLKYEVDGEDETGRIRGKHIGTGIARPAFWERARYFGLERELADALDKAQS